MTQAPAIVPETEPPPHADGGDTSLPASFAQERLWFLHQIDAGSPLYNIPLAYDVRGPLNIGLLRESILDIIRRHESLRTNLAFEHGALVQVIHEDADFTLDVQDLSTLPDDERETRAAAAARSFIRRPFDLSKQPLLRVLLLKIGEESHQIVLNFQHSVFDGVSLGIFLRELAECYGARLEGREPALEPLPIQYGDFAVWQRQSLGGPLLEKQIAFWKERLREIPPPLELPTDRQPPKQPTTTGGDLFFTVPAAVHFALRDLCQREGVTLFMALTAAFQALLFRYTGQERMLTGAPVANRNHSETDRLIGLFVNTMVLRGDFRGDPSVRDLLRRTREETLSAVEHGDLPFEKLVQEMQIGQRDGRNPLFRTMLVLQTHAPISGFRDLEFRPMGHELNAAILDLLFEMIDDGTGLRGGISYSTDLFDRATIERLAGHFQTLLVMADLANVRSSPRYRALLGRLRARG
ncbi:MAG: condensation domain-containing protein [Chthoniobacteraceae bacterium]